MMLIWGLFQCITVIIDVYCIILYAFVMLLELTGVNMIKSCIFISVLWKADWCMMCCMKTINRKKHCLRRYGPDNSACCSPQGSSNIFKFNVLAFASKDLHVLLLSIEMLRLCYVTCCYNSVKCAEIVEQFWLQYSLWWGFSNISADAREFYHTWTMLLHYLVHRLPGNGLCFCPDLKFYTVDLSHPLTDRHK